MSVPNWAEDLFVAGLYDGVVDECNLQGTLELHKRDTVSTFGTRSSRRVSKDTKKALKESQVENIENGDVHQSGVASTLTEKVNVNPHGTDSSTQRKVQVRDYIILIKTILCHTYLSCCHRNVPSFIGSTQSAIMSSSLITLLSVSEKNERSTVSTVSSITSLSPIPVIECACRE